MATAPFFVRHPNSRATNSLLPSTTQSTLNYSNELVWMVRQPPEPPITLKFSRNGLSLILAKRIRRS